MGITIKSENCIEFLEEPEPDFSNIQEIPENFGLMVIRRCASTFHYCYNPDNKQNTFEVAFHFDWL